MKITHKFSAVLTLLMATMFLTATTTSARNLRNGAVYVLTNQVINAIAVFERSPDGTLVPAGSFLTGGAGDPVAQPGDSPNDPLASQGSLILDNQLLFAVNAGSNEISVLRVGREELTLVDIIASGGVRPISLTVRNNLLYVLNEGDTPNITGFTVGMDGSLTPLASSTRFLPGGSGADPAQIGFSPDGSSLTVTEKLGNTIDTYAVGQTGTPSAANPDLSSGLTPFGFAFRADGVLVVAEAFGGAATQGKASSYSTDSEGIAVISRSVADSQTTASRVAITDSGKLVFVSNSGSNAISSYQLDVAGALSLLQSAAGNTGAGSAPIDIALSDKSRHLYVSDNGLQMVHAFVINKDGTLTSIDNESGLPFGIQGIAAH